MSRACQHPLPFLLCMCCLLWQGAVAGEGDRGGTGAEAQALRRQDRLGKLFCLGEEAAVPVECNEVEGS